MTIENKQEKSTTVWPEGNVVEVKPEVDFVYIMRKDGLFSTGPIAEAVAVDYGLDNQEVGVVLLGQYDKFFDKLAEVFAWAYESKGVFELHLFDPDQLDEQVRSKADDLPIVSLDPLMSSGVYEHKVSRGYYLGGTTDFGQVPRPGSLDLLVQAGQITSLLEGQEVCVAEDDVFTGGSLVASLLGLLSEGVQVEKVVPGIQVGKPEKVKEMGIEIDPAVEYMVSDGVDIFDKVDLGDPRDYLLGASGLVVKLPSGEFGRAPYLLPFVSTAARAGIPDQIEDEFAHKVLVADQAFFDAVQSELGIEVKIKHMEVHFAQMMQEVYGVEGETTMVDLISWLQSNLIELWGLTQEFGELQQGLEKLQLPEKIVLVDVNGTILSDDNVTGEVALDDQKELEKAVAKLEEQGVVVGLCSDSPLEQLIEFSKKLGLNGPVLAENGNLLYYQDQIVVLKNLEDLEELKRGVHDFASKMGLIQLNDCIAAEFGGEVIEFGGDEWAFGANRETSVSLFGPAEFVVTVGEELQGLAGVSVDCSPEFGYLAIHPGADYKKSKGGVLAKLAAFGHELVMVGNSMSDWVDPETGVGCCFVGNSSVGGEILEQSLIVSDLPNIKGVIEILGGLYE